MKLLDVVGDYVKENKSGIAIGVGLALSLVGAVFTAKAAVKSKEKIEEAKKEKDISADEKLPVRETVKVCWKEWIPAVLSYGFSFACIIRGKQIDEKRLAAASIAYEFLDTFSKEYGNKVREQIGEEADKKIREDILKDKEIACPSEDLVLYDGDTYFYEPFFGKIFISNTLKIQKAINIFNDRLNNDGTGSYNDLFEEIYQQTPVSLNKKMICEGGDYIGYDVSKGLLEPDSIPGKDILSNGKEVPVLILRLISKKSGQDLIPTTFYQFV